MATNKPTIKLDRLDYERIKEIALKNRIDVKDKPRFSREQIAKKRMVDVKVCCFICGKKTIMMNPSHWKENFLYWFDILEWDRKTNVIDVVCRKCKTS